MASALGRLAACAGALQTDFATPGALSNVHLLPFYTEGLDDPGRMARDDEIGGPVHNPYDETDPAPTLTAVSGPVSVAADMNTLPFWLSLLFGEASAPTGAGPYTRTWDSSKEPEFGTVQFKTAASRWKIVRGLAFSGLDFDLTKQDGYRQFTFAGQARELEAITVEGNLPLDTAGLSLPARAKAPATTGQILIDDVLIGRLSAGGFAYQSALDRSNDLDGKSTSTDMERGPGSSVTVRPTIRLKNDNSQDALLAKLQGSADRNTGEVGTPFKCEVRFALTASASLSFVMERCFGEKRFEAIGGPGGLSIQPEIRGIQSATDPAVKVTLVNSIATFQ